MSSEPSTTDQNVARALRANLQGVQRQSEELHQAIADLVAACSSNRPANALPHLLRAEASAASLAAVLEVLAKFVAGSASSQPSRRAEDRTAEQNVSASESRARESFVEQAASPSFAVAEAAHAPQIVPAEPAVVESAPQVVVDAEPIQEEAEIHDVHAAEVTEEISEPPAPESSASHEVAAEHETIEVEAEETAHSSAPVAEEHTSEPIVQAIAEPVQETPALIVPAPAEAHEPLPIEAFANSEQSGDEIEVIETASADSGHNGHVAGHVAEGSIAEAMGFAATQPASEASVEQSEVFDLGTLPADQQEMHRRANRVAKVSMQDIQLLRPDLVQQGRVTKDICIRLRDEIDKARREYERRFRPILGQGSDYFYYWMVEVLGAGDPETLGEYPYHAPVLRH